VLPEPYDGHEYALVCTAVEVAFIAEASFIGEASFMVETSFIVEDAIVEGSIMVEDESIIPLAGVAVGITESDIRMP